MTASQQVAARFVLAALLSLPLACTDDPAGSPAPSSAASGRGGGGGRSEGVGGASGAALAEAGTGGTAGGPGTGGGGAGGAAGGGAGSAGKAGGTGGSGDTCSSGARDGNETDVDCGGSCAPCAGWKACAQDAGCASSICVEGVCAPAPAFASGKTVASISLNSLVVAADFDANGTMDFALAGRSEKKVVVYLNDGKGKFAKATAVSVSIGATGIVAGDFDADGHIDVAVSGNGGGIGMGGVFLLRGSSGGHLEDPVVAVEGLGFFHGMVAGDFDSDGIDDVAGVAGTVVILLGAKEKPLSKMRSTAGGYGVAHLAAGDFDGDKKRDLAVGPGAPTSVEVFLQTPSWLGDTSAPASAFSSPDLDAFYGVAAGDLDGDGLDDLLVASVGDRKLGVALAEGTGQFGKRKVVASFPSVGDAFFTPFVADLNGDGRPDVGATTTGDPDSFVLCAGRGDGTFAKYVSHPAARNAKSIVTADFDGDDLLDVLSVAGNGEVGGAVLTRNTTLKKP